MLNNATTEEFMRTGILTEEIRDELKRRRNALGLSRNSLSSTLGIDYSTLTRWEDGCTCCVKTMLRKMLRDFLTGGLDDCFRRLATVGACGKGREHSIVVGGIGRISSICRDAEGKRELARRLEELEASLKKRLASTQRGDSERPSDAFPKKNDCQDG